jgi:hypothetical protein
MHLTLSEAQNIYHVEIIVLDRPSLFHMSHLAVTVEWTVFVATVNLACWIALLGVKSFPGSI